jgi:LysR family transcriptional regulator (chromosome initiation inhibitor)
LQLLEDATLEELLPGPQSREPAELSIAVNADSLATWFPPVLWRLLTAHRLAIEVVTDDQDHTLERLARGEVIGCVSTQARAASGFVAEPLGAMEYRCVAAPDFAHRHFDRGLSLKAVLGAAAVVFNRKDSLHDEFLQAVFGFRVGRYTKHFLPSASALLGGIEAGIGYGLVPSHQLAKSCGVPALVELAPQHPVLVELHWHHWEIEPALSSHITRLVKEHAASALRQMDS